VIERCIEKRAYFSSGGCDLEKKEKAK